MPARLRGHLRHNVVGYVALFIALGGTGAYAANEWTGANIVNESLTGADVRGRPGTSTTADVNGSLTTDDISGQRANPANGTPFIDGTVTQWDIRNGSVTGSDVVESSLAKVPDADELDNLDSTQLSPASGDGRTADLRILGTATVLTANITTARSASLLVSAALTLKVFGGGGGSRVACRLVFDDGPASVEYVTGMSDGTNDYVTMPVVWAHGVGAGAHTVDLECRVIIGSAPTVIDAGMTVSAHV